MSTYDQMIEIGVEQPLTTLFKTAHQQGIDITKLANQDYGLSKECVTIIVDDIKRGLL